MSDNIKEISKALLLMSLGRIYVIMWTPLDDFERSFAKEETNRLWYSQDYVNYVFKEY